MALGTNRLPLGTEIVATLDFGPIVRGQLGIITDVVSTTRGITSQMQYVGTFLGGMKATAKPAQIAPLRHGCTLALLREPLWFLQHREVGEGFARYAAWSKRQSMQHDGE